MRARAARQSALIAVVSALAVGFSAGTACADDVGERIRAEQRDRLERNADAASDQRERTLLQERTRRLERLDAPRRLDRARRAQERLGRRLRGPETPSLSQSLTERRLNARKPKLHGGPGLPSAP
ncbi:MAG: hypothetical protein AAFW46_09150 [Pseudomonadota bacterium]